MNLKWCKIEMASLMATPLVGVWVVALLTAAPCIRADEVYDLLNSVEFRNEGVTSVSDTAHTLASTHSCSVVRLELAVSVQVSDD